jgi:copper resistance protein D
MDLSLALALCRFLHVGSAMFLFGAFAYLCVLVPATLAKHVEAALQPLRLVAIALAALTTAVALPLAAATIGDGWQDAFDPASIQAILLETDVGRAWQMQAIAALLLVATIVARPCDRRGATAVASAFLLAGLALTGHASMQEGGLGLIHRINDVVHVLAGGAWLGALVPLLLILRRLDRPGDRVAAAEALDAFSFAGRFIVAIVVGSGVVNTLLILGHLPTDLSSPYQLMLLGKIGLVAVMIGLAISNRYLFLPRLRGQTADTLSAIRTATIAEIALGAVVLALVSLFGTMDPA